MQQYVVHRPFNVFELGEIVELDPEDGGTKALLRVGKIVPVIDPDADEPDEGDEDAAE